ncbi:MAG: aspartate kinase [Peptoniphilaceae bacterium]|nr:aspartate kinase [Peptoniphilaceae bacterium]MDY3738572.1 aspartate kinase [Peptoniphilaceae bacterium]
MKKITVAKFGGSSLADSNQFIKVKNIIENDNSRTIIVPSAPGKSKNEKHKITDLLLMCYQLASHNLNINEVYQFVEDRFKSIRDDLDINFDIEKELEKIKVNIISNPNSDYTASRGEYLNALLLASFLGFEFIDSSKLIFFNNDRTVNYEYTNNAIRKEDIKNKKCVIPGFYGRDFDGKTITFPRSGSDVSASVIANGVCADLYENWTDVNGFLAADPSIVNTKLIKKITYTELRELSYMGAEVLYEDAVFPVVKNKIPINIRNTNDPENDGTMIISDDDNLSTTPSITGVAGKKGFSVFNISKTKRSEDLTFIRKLVSVFETNDVHIEQMPSSIDSVSVVVPFNEISSKQSKIIEEINIYCSPDSITIYHNMSLIAVVGRGMINVKGSSAKIFHALSKENINVRMISQGSSEMNIIIGVVEKDFENSIKTICKEFNLTEDA